MKGTSTNKNDANNTYNSSIDMAIGYIKQGEYKLAIATLDAIKKANFLNCK